MASGTISAPFRARARILSLLGDQLIGSDHLAIFELVKNAYDADATQAKVSMLDLNGKNPRIVVVDDGTGMDLDVLRNVWLEPASDFREKEREAGKRTPKFRRLPLGEKGVGRFAVHKLGEKISLVTRPIGSTEEFCVDIDWRAFQKVQYLDQTEVKILSRKPEYFTGKNGTSKHGTYVSISALRRPDWMRGDIRRLFRSITSISSPFDTDDAFHATLEVPEFPHYIDEMPAARELIEMAPWRFSFTFDGRLNWQYEFTSPEQKRVAGRKSKGVEDDLLVEPGEHANSKTRPVADKSMLDGIGPISGTFVAFDRDQKIIELIGRRDMVRGMLNEQSGVRVYRDGVRVYNYGEPADDWLELDIRRVNRPAQRLSRNIVLGAVNLSLADSTQLREKTNREGFDQNAAFDRFKRLVIGILHVFETERQEDKERLRKVLDKSSDAIDVPVEGPLEKLKIAISKTKEAPKLLPLIERATNEFHEMRDLLLRAGMTGINLAVVIHEVERGIRALHEAVRQGASKAELEKLSRSLMSLVESVAGLLRQKSRDKVDLREIVQEAAEINVRRFPRHDVHVTYELGPEKAKAAIVVGSYTLLLNVLVNLIDNAIYWLRVRWPDEEKPSKGRRKIHIRLTDDLGDGIALVVADNGPGFRDAPEVLTKPFFSRRPDGIGLGLYYASLAMSLSGGTLAFPDKDDVELPKGMSGAVVAMHFNSKQKSR